MSQESENYLSSNCSDYSPSQTPESEDYSSYESSSLETPSESDYSIASSGKCSGSSDYNSSYFTDSESDSQSS